ncbi:MAG: portal protein, partial [Thermodesulfobacteriota bacterium]|nr:portal protein [Thermodesulfobacteriota bacterium]
SQYTTMESKRQPFLDRARTSCKYTIPTLLLPDDGFSGDAEIKKQFQGLGARGVNNLASKLLTSLLPVNSPFFRLQINDYNVKELTQADDQRAEIEQALNQIERAVMVKVETNGIRVPIFTTLKLLIATGNALLFVNKEGKIRSYTIENYVVSRDTFGNVKKIITKDIVNVYNLSEDIRNQIISEMTEDDLLESEDVELYTSVVLQEDGSWEITQEIKDIVVEQYITKTNQYVPLRWTAMVGEDYGRSLVEEYVGDLKTLETLTKAIYDTSKLTSQVIFLVNPATQTKVRDLAKAQTGDFVTGRLGDIETLQINKFNDLSIAQNTILQVEKRLSYAFLLNSSVQRQAERVTLGEISYMAEELESALGGVYSVLSQELQLPLVKILMEAMTKGKEIPKLPDNLIEPTITTGLEALGRGNDLNKLNQFIGIVSQLGPEAMSQRLNIGDYITRVGASLGIDTQGLIVSDEQIQQQQQQQMVQQQIQQEQ